MTDEALRRNFSIDGILLPLTPATTQLFVKQFSPTMARRAAEKADGSRLFARKAIRTAYDSLRTHAYYVDMHLENPEVILEEAQQTVNSALSSCKLAATTVGTLVSRYKHIRQEARENIRDKSDEELIAAFEVYSTSNILVMRLEYRRQALEYRIQRLVDARITLQTRIAKNT